MVGILTPEQQNRSRQITKLEGGFGALNDSESFAQALFYNHQKVRSCSQNIQITNTKFSMTDIISGGKKTTCVYQKLTERTRHVLLRSTPNRRELYRKKNASWRLSFVVSLVEGCSVLPE